MEGVHWVCLRPISLQDDPSYRPAVASAAQKSIDEHIRELAERRNALSPISKLPPEMLSTIFSFVVARRRELEALSKPVVPFYFFTHVCRSWRFVALNTPRLWQVITEPGIPSPWTITMLERSKAADLIFVSKLLDEFFDSSHMKEILTQHTSRIRELDLTLGPSSVPIVASIFEGLPQSSLRLHSLQWTYSYWVEDHYPTFPTGLLETDSLEKLQVDNCNGPWYSISSRALTNLKLHKISNRPLMIEFLEFLRRHSKLQVLDLEDSLPSAMNVKCDPVNLPSLQRLRLSSTTNQKDVINILSHIIVPPSATLRFHMANLGAEDSLNDFTSFSAFLGRAGADISYRDLDVLSDGAGIHLLAWKGERTSTADLQVIVDFFIVPQNMVRNIFRSLPLFNITSLTLQIDPDYIWLQDTFSHLPHLQNVNVIGNCAFGFIETLTQKRENYNNQLSDYLSVTFPALEFLWIQDVPFDPFHSEGVCNVQDCLMERYEREAELVKLKITGCNGLCDEDMVKLREIVVDVEWDEYTEQDEYLELLDTWEI